MTDMKKIVQLAERHGWSVERTKRGHLRFRNAEGWVVAFHGSTPSCSRSLQNLRAQLRRAGLETDPRRLNGRSEAP